MANLGAQLGQYIERRLAEEDANRSAALKSAVIESSLDSVITMDHHGRVLDFSPSAERTFGYRRDEAIGNELAELIVPPELREQHRAALARYLETGVGRILDQRLELTGMRSDGSFFPVEVSITAGRRHRSAHIRRLSAGHHTAPADRAGPGGAA